MVTRRGWRPSGRGIPTNAAGFVGAVVLTVLAVFACLPSLAFAEGPSAEFRLEGSVPATVRGEPSNQSMLAPFGPGAVEYVCKPPPFAAGIPKGVEEAGGTVFGTVTSEGEQAGTCYPESNPVPLEMNGCQITFEPGEPLTAESTLGTIKMGPVGCGPIISQSIYSCQLELSPNSWREQTVEFRNIGSGPEGTVQVLAQLAGLEEKLEGPYFCPDGSYEADWTINWTLRAEDESFQPRGLAVINPAAGTPPSAVTEPATNAKAASATLHAAVNPNGSTTSYQFQYGATTEYGSVVPASVQNVGSGVQEVAVSQTPAGLAEETLYHYRVVAENSAGTTYGSDRTFSTLHLPEARTEGASEVRAYRATLNGTVNPQGGETSYYFEYGTTQSYGHTTGGWPPLSGSSDVAVEKSACCDLEPDTTYHYRLVAESQAGKSYGEDETFTTETAPQTTITSPTLSYIGSEREAIEFASSKPGSSFQCSFDEAKWEPCESPYELPRPLGSEWHHFKVYATDSQGNQDLTPAEWTFKAEAYPAAPSASNSKLVYPEEGKKTASYYTLQAEWGKGAKSGGVTGVAFQMQLPKWDAFKDVPAGCVIDGEGKKVSWPLAAESNPDHSEHSEPVYFKAKGCAPFEAEGYPQGGVKFRAVFDGGESVSGASEAVTTEFIFEDNAQLVTTDARESIGPGTLDLLTGDYTISRTDVSIPVPGSEATLEFTRTYDSSLTNHLPGYSYALGGEWQPSLPVEQEAEGEAWTALEEWAIPPREAVFAEECWTAEGTEVACGPQNQPCNEEHMCERWEEEEAQPEEKWMELVDNEGNGIPFVITGTVEKPIYTAPEWASELTLSRTDASHMALSEPNGTNTTFELTAGNEYRPSEISVQATPRSTRMVYHAAEFGHQLLLTEEIAPAPPGMFDSECPEEVSIKTPGCRTLKFNYQLAPGSDQQYVLDSIRYYTATKGSEYNESDEVAEYKYNQYAQLVEERDPQTGLAETYTYDGDTHITSLKPPGEQPWEFEYGARVDPHGEWGSLLERVSRASLVEGEPTATTTIAYEVPLSGEGAPYDMSPQSVAEWGQSDLPVDATAIFPPTHVPSSYPPSEYSGATIHYMDPEGYEVNTASPELPGASGPSITTTETNAKGEVVRELGAQARLEALEAEDPVARSRELDTHSTFAYSEGGAELTESESWGPLHEVRLEDGEEVEARQHTHVKYDEGFTEHKAGEAWPNLPTWERTSAEIPSKEEEEEVEPRIVETKYDWEFRQPEKEITNPGHGEEELVRVTAYNHWGQVGEVRQPSDSEGTSPAGGTETVYYYAGQDPFPDCQFKPAWAGLPCEILHVGPASPEGENPKLLVKRIAKYSPLDEPEEVIESPAGAEEAGKTRTTTLEYDGAGRPKLKRTKGASEAETLPAVETTYNEATGKPEAQRLLCEAPENCIGFDSQEVKTTYDSLGRP